MGFDPFQDQILRSCATFSMGAPCRAAVRIESIRTAPDFSLCHSLLPLDLDVSFFQLQTYVQSG